MIVADTSAILAHIFGEPGGDWIHKDANDVVISTVNVTEVVSKLLEKGWKFAEAVADLDALGLGMSDHSMETAHLAGAIHLATRRKGLSLGDRACLALAIREGATAVTADRNWAGLDIGCKIEIIR